MHQKRKELGEQSRQNILAAAARLISEHGYDGTSMSMIVKECGLPASSIYWHFTNKEGVLAAVMEAGALHFFEGVRTIEWPDGTPAERLRHGFLITGHLLLDDPEHVQFLRIQLRFRLNDKIHRDRSYYDAATAVRQQGVSNMRGLIAEAYSAAGPLAERIGDELARFGVALIDGVFLAVQGEGGAPSGPLLGQAADALVAQAEAAAERLRS